MNNPIEKRIQQVSELAKNAFKDHSIKLDWSAPSGCAKSWLCTNNGSSIYGFRLTAFPYVLMTNGDLGTLVVERNPDMISWARQAIHSIDYFASKVSRDIEVKEYDPEIAEIVIKELLNEFKNEDDYPSPSYLSLSYQESLDHYHDQFEYLDYDNYHAVCTAIYESGFFDGSDFPDLMNFKHSFLWQRESMIWALNQGIKLYE